MAIDTRDRRASALSHFGFLVFPIPDGTIDTDDRRQAAGFYRGLSTAGEPEYGPIPIPSPNAGESMALYCVSTLSGGSTVENPSSSSGESMAQYCLSTLEAGASMAETCLSTLEGGATIPTS